MDHTEDWAQDRELVDRVFRGQLAGMVRTAREFDADGAHWEVWLDPADSSRAPRMVGQPPLGVGGMIGLISSGSTHGLGVARHSTRAGALTYQFFAVCA